jgi:CheY-like chemotaxis protein
VNARVLIVDDNAGFRRLAGGLLESEGCQVVGAVENGSEALAAVRRLAPDVVLLDVHLPDASGFELAALLVREGPGPIVVLTSTHARDDFDQLAAQSGAQGFVSKDDLSGATIQRLLA